MVGVATFDRDWPVCSSTAGGGDEAATVGRANEVLGIFSLKCIAEGLIAGEVEGTVLVVGVVIDEQFVSGWSAEDGGCTSGIESASVVVVDEIIGIIWNNYWKQKELLNKERGVCLSQAPFPLP